MHFSPAPNWWLLRVKSVHARSSATLRGIGRALGVALLLWVCCMLFPAPILADNWQPTLYSDLLPSRLVAVDKARQTFLVYEKKSPLRLKYRYDCSTGQVAGDKQFLNDLRTPEGVYFVNYKIADGLDFKEYGGLAYTLNYPNPVDRLRGKTGHGIWIHSKGFGIEPMGTRGCVAIGLRDIDEAGPDLAPGTAVILAGNVDEQRLSSPNADTARHLQQLMARWSQAWASRSPKMFQFYDTQAYTKAMPESFAAFRMTKERLFKMLQFIHIYNRKIHVLEGPGYWVTWSEQFYRASNLSTEGIRRLYWQRGNDGKFRIVGMEWTPRNLGMQADFRAGRLVADARAANATDAAAEAPVPPALEMPETANAAVSDGKQQQTATLQVAAASDPLVPRPRSVNPPAEVNWGKRFALENPAENQQKSAEVTRQNPQKEQPSVAAPQSAAVDTKAAALQLSPALRTELENRVQAWQKALAERSPQLAGFYDPERYNRQPDTPRGASYATMWRQMEKRIKAPWLRVLSRKPVIEVNGALAVSQNDLLVVAPAKTEEGVERLWWRKGQDGVFRIVAAQFQPQIKGLSAEYLDSVSGEASAMLENWRKAWEAGRLDDYMAFYTPDAMQQRRKGSASIRAQKKTLWARVRPVRVQLTGVRLTVDGNGLRADMGQIYSDNSGHSDRGTKTLLLRYDGRQWRIAREDWTASSPSASR